MAMGFKPFRFKQFNVADDRCAHKVGTDGVLLGSWVDVLSDDRLLLDIGTGSGVIALMLAQRSHSASHVDAIDTQEAEVAQATENVRQSPWPGKITVVKTAAQIFFPDRSYDLIVSNPPYFVDSLLPPNESRAQARHARELSFDELLLAASRLLAPEGRFGIVLPFPEGQEFLKLARSYSLYPARLTTFRSRKEKPVERLLAEFSRNVRPAAESEIILYSEGNRWTEGYKKLTREFYLRA